MGRRHEIRGRRRPSRISGLLITAIICSCAIGLHGGCANDPYSQERIALREAKIRQTIQAMDDHEAAAAVRLRNRLQRMDDWYREDEKMFQQRMRTAGNNIW